MLALPTSCAAARPAAAEPAAVAALPALLSGIVNKGEAPREADGPTGAPNRPCLPAMSLPARFAVCRPAWPQQPCSTLGAGSCLQPGVAPTPPRSGSDWNAGALAPPLTLVVSRSGAVSLAKDAAGMLCGVAATLLLHQALPPDKPGLPNTGSVAAAAPPLGPVPAEVPAVPPACLLPAPGAPAVVPADMPGTAKPCQLSPGARGAAAALCRPAGPGLASWLLPGTAPEVGVRLAGVWGVCGRVKPADRDSGLQAMGE
ncbi:hypothetical protein V8C86DRAFT_2613338 [Haematococcus lacustris]